MSKGQAIVIGLTGQSGAGKTTVCDFFACAGFGIINCDLISREVVSDESSCKADLVAAFSNVILNEDQTLNRKALGRIVFSNQGKLNLLNQITHPYILKKVVSQINELNKNGFEYIIVDAPTLFESGAEKMCDLVISVLAHKEIRIKRIMERDHISFEDAVLRINVQHEDDFFITNSDFVVYNNADRTALLSQLNDILALIKEGKYGH